MFHTCEWLQALSRSYGYQPVVYTTSAPERGLVNGMPFCRIRSYLTGRRLVSLPFSDHCQPLVGNSGELLELLSAAKEDSITDGYRYLEIRPIREDENSVVAAKDFSGKETFVVHKLDLRAGVEQVYRNLHHNSVHRKITRAQREGLSYEEGTSEDLLMKFYRLFLLTRRRHRLPPQPTAWFQNLIHCFGDRLKIRVVSKNDTPTASIITISYKKGMTYKYGCSDPRFNALGGMVGLVWRAIQEAIEEGAYEFDLGRSECGNAGLITFKDHWGAKQHQIRYYSYPPAKAGGSGNTALMKVVRSLSTSVPDSVLVALGRFLYPHAG
jgi:hypothetical protein